MPGIPIARVGDPTQGGPLSQTIIAGSPNVFVNGGQTAPSPAELNYQMSEVGGFAAKTLEELGPEFSAEATQEIIQIGGPFALMDDPDSIKNLPVELVKAQRASAPPQQEPEEAKVVREKPVEATIAPACGNFTTNFKYSDKLSTKYTIGNFSTGCIFSHTIKAQHGFTIPEILCNLKAVAEIVEKIDQKYPGVRVNSAFRTSTGGKSQHERGMAADLQWPGISNQEYLTRAKWITANLTFDQFLFEHGNSIWLHVSYDRNKGQQRMDVRTMINGTYPAGLKLFYK